MVDAYYFCIGGSVGQFAAIARPVGFRCAAADVPDAIERLLAAFDERRDAGENLRAFLARHSNGDIRAILAGSLVVPVERDLAVGPVPQGVEG
jgi:sulfite reductase (ferredoxin)